LIFGLFRSGECLRVPPRHPIPDARDQEKLANGERRDQDGGGLHFWAAFFRFARSVRALAAALEAFVAIFRRSSALIDFERAIPPNRAISRTSIG